MAERPPIAHGSWINIGDLQCLVSVVRMDADPEGDCEVVFNPSNPTYGNVRWNGRAWQFAETADLGGRADKISRLTAYVQALKRGPRQ